MPIPDWQRQMRLAGPFQQLVMLALARLGPDTSAASIRFEIKRRTGRHISITATHTTLQRLAARGYTRSWTRPTFRYRAFDPAEWKWCSRSMLKTAARRFHELLTMGRRALRLTLAAEDAMRPGLPGLGREHELFQQNAPPVGGTLRWGPSNRAGRRRENYGPIDPDYCPIETGSTAGGA